MRFRGCFVQFKGGTLQIEIHAWFYSMKWANCEYTCGRFNNLTIYGHANDGK